MRDFQLGDIWSQLRNRFRRNHSLSSADASQPEPAPVEAPRRLGLVLGGGGGRGGAHLGVLAVLDALTMPIDLLVGTSIGGAIGVLHAAGLSLPEVSQVFRSSGLRHIATTDPSRTGLIGSTKREALLTRVLGDKTFADLRFPCAVVTVDLVSGQQVVINEGPLVPALLATTALPGFLPPVVRGAEILVDGAVRNNLPVDVAESLGAQKVIAVELSDAQPGFELPTDLPGNPLARLMLAPQQLAVANRSLALLMDQVNQMRLERHPPALYLRPEIKLVELLDMSRPEVGWAAGEAAARSVEAELLALKAWRLEGVADAPFAPVPPATAMELAIPHDPVVAEAPVVLLPAPGLPRWPRFALPPDWRLPAFPSRK